MLFDFNFRVPLPFRNPFATDPSPPGIIANSQSRPRPINLSPNAIAHSPQSQKRRRGWQPVESPGPLSTFRTNTLAQGSLDNGTNLRREDYNGEEGANFESDGLDLPPTKRRRTTLADNLLTSALNVALVSTALGITAIRYSVSI